MSPYHQEPHPPGRCIALAEGECCADPPAPKPSHDRRMAACAAEVLKRMLAWCMWHYDRAVLRAIDDGEGCEALLVLADAINDLRLAVEAGAGGVLGSWVVLFPDGSCNRPMGARNGEFVAACASVRHAMDVALFKAQIDDAEGAGHRSTDEFDQLVEVETSHMRMLWHTFRGIEEDRLFARDGTYSIAKAWQYIAERLAEAPGYPNEMSETV